MKLLLVFFLPILSCQNSSSATNQNVEITSVGTKQLILDDLRNQVACETYKPADIAKILNWNAATITSESMGHSEGKRSLCRFGHQTENLWVRLGWKSQKAADMKALETQYEGYLSNGENGIGYESLEGNEVLFGEKPADASNPKLYIFRKRFGNKAEVTFELYSNALNKEDALKAFYALLKRL